ncbi:MAG TPA: SDR family NAD(P)-dependent oxidoreductase [Chloroflexota bacterium]
MANEQRLSDKVGLVTGGSRGAGLAIARALAGQGMAVGVMARGAEPVAAAVGQIEASGGRALGLVGDVSSPADVERGVADLVARFGRLDLVVNNAAIGGRGSAESMPVETWRGIVEVNLVGAYLCARAAIPHLRAAGGGWIVGIASGAARQGYPEMSAYCASKFGLLGLNQSLAAELGGDNIKVSTILPGSIMTEFGGRGREEKEARRRAGDKYIESEDVAQAVLFLLTQPGRAWTQELNVWPF